MKKIALLFSSVVIVAALLGLFSVPTAEAINVFNQCGQQASGSAVCGSTGDDAYAMIQIVINTLFTVLGIIAVIMIIVGGIRYATSGGDSGSTKAAKDTVLYSVIGLVVAIMSYAIVNFVLNQFIKG